MNLKETIYAGRNNAVRLTLSEDGQPFHLAYPGVTPTRWLLKIYSNPVIEFDSDTNLSAFSWDGLTSTLEIRIGTLVTNGLDYTDTALVVYSLLWPSGIVWTNPTCSPDKLQVRVCTTS